MSLARYQLDAPIGSGGAATVYRARDRETGARVAVKLAHRPADPDARFEREAAVLAVIASEHVVRVLAAGRENGVPYVVMELLEGQDLEQQLRHGRSTAARDVVGWLRQAARALDLAHGVGLVHRDLKPSNLFLERSGRLKVLDFGLVKQTGDVRAGDDSLAGTPQFMAPEQVRGQNARIGPATDVWAVGMLAVRLLTGEPYWRGATVLDVLGQIDSEPMVAPSTRWPWLPPAFDEWFARACHRNAARRFPSVGAEVTALARAMAGATGELVPSGSPGDALSSHVTQFLVRVSGRRLIGRIAEQRQLARRLAGAPGLITITGPGGIGKTALAEQVVAQVADGFPDGVYRVRLADGAAELAQALAQQIGGDAATLLAERRALVWIDGVDPAGRTTLAALRARAPRVTWLVTSRAPLELPGEERVVLTPLDLPAEGISVEEASRYDALNLFTVRAAEAAPGFALRPGDVPDATRLVRAAGGIPLAIELAASQLDKLPLSAVAARIAGGGAPIADALAGSLDVLEAGPRRVLQALSVTGAGATAVEVRALTGVSPDAPLEALAARGLVHPIPEEPVRWVVLPPIRELALRALGDDPGLRRRWIDLLVAARDPFRLDDATDALGWALGASPADALRLAASLVDAWALRGHYAEGIRWISRVLDRAPPAASRERRAALEGAGRLAILSCRYEDAERWTADAARMARALDDDAGLAAADQLLGSIARERGEYVRAAARHEAARRRFVRLGDARQVARSFSYLAFAAWLAGDLTAAARAAAQIELEDDDDEGWAWYHLNRGAIALHGGDVAAAEVELAHALDISSRAAYAEGIAWSLELRGRLSLRAGDLLAAEARLRAALRVHHRLGDWWRCASVLEGLAAATSAPELLATARALRAALGVPVPRCERSQPVASSPGDRRSWRERLEEVVRRA